MKVFIDTEFTSFHDMELLSLGLVREDGEAFYVETTDPSRIARASSFCQEVVIPQFGFIEGAGVRGDAEAGLRVAHWLRACGLVEGRGVQILGDFQGDFQLLHHALAQCGEWEALKRSIEFVDISGVHDSLDCVLAAQSFFDDTQRPHPHLLRHHALVDAMALAHAWRVHDELGFSGRKQPHSHPVNNTLEEAP